MDKYKIASEFFSNGCNCAQAVFAAFADEMGLDKDTSMRISSSFGAGIGRMRHVCGACSGMFMVAGALYGTTEGDGDKAKGEHYALIQDMAQRFKDKNNGTIICSELLAGLAASRSTSPMPDARCPEYYNSRPCAKLVMDAVEIMQEIIAEHNKS